MSKVTPRDVSSLIQNMRKLFFGGVSNNFLPDRLDHRHRYERSGLVNFTHLFLRLTESLQNPLKT